MSAEIKVSALYEYPIKSCAGVESQQLRITERGLPCDRRWMVVDPQGKFITQREFSKMALIAPQITDDKLIIQAQDERSILEIPLTYLGNPKQVEVWGNKLEGVDEGDIASQWFSDYLGVNCRLVHMDPGFVREKQSARFGFADSYPLLITSEDSLRDLNEKIIQSGDQPVPMDRFRPNIVVTTDEPYAEDSWGKIKIDTVEIDVVKPCIRCPIPQINQETGKKGRQPSKELYRSRRISPKEVIFGQKAVYRNSGIIYVASKVEVLAQKDPPDLLR